MKEGVRVQVLSSFDSPDQDDLPGTLIVSEAEIEGSGMERQLITGIAHDKNESQITITRVPDRPGALASIFGPLADPAIYVDLIIQNVCSVTAETVVTFTVSAGALARIL